MTGGVVGVVSKVGTSGVGSNGPGAAVMAGAEVAEVIFSSQGQRTGGLTAANSGTGSGGTGGIGSSGEQTGSGLMASSKAWAQNTGDVGSSGAQGTSDGSGGTGGVSRAQGMGGCCSAEEFSGAQGRGDGSGGTGGVGSSGEQMGGFSGLTMG